MKFIFPFRLSGTNDIIRLAAWNRFLGGKKRKEEKEMCAAYVRSQMKGKAKGPVVIHIEWTEPNAKRDLDNICGGIKVIADSLVMCGVIPNDTRTWIRGISHSFPEPDKKNPKIVVTLTEC